MEKLPCGGPESSLYPLMAGKVQADPDVPTIAGTRR